MVSLPLTVLCVSSLNFLRDAMYGTTSRNDENFIYWSCPNFVDENSFYAYLNRPFSLVIHP